ncbi:hypothetical protein DSO57_1027743 [Entomophthora muscae]|uniref:Uncharacterized protein n=1 Tax=Entomophthora muscae TaxID=34485 RepID=A0ACC2UCG5_9FUNG|nr:hypothetical protein DSO57_1027743 [Entomophthora muscae]
MEPLVGETGTLLSSNPILLNALVLIAPPAKVVEASEEVLAVTLLLDTGRMANMNGAKKMHDLKRNFTELLKILIARTLVSTLPSMMIFQLMLLVEMFQAPSLPLMNQN